VTRLTRNGSHGKNHGSPDPPNSFREPDIPQDLFFAWEFSERNFTREDGNGSGSGSMATRWSRDTTNPRTHEPAHDNWLLHDLVTVIGAQTKTLSPFRVLDTHLHD
jgi:hypothetical protein